MPNKKPKHVMSLRPAPAANANGGSPSQDASEDDGDELPLVWDKVSDKILKHINARFDKLDQTLQAVQSSQKELLEKVEAVEEQVLDQG